MAIPLRVLLIEDSPDDAELIRRALRKSGYYVILERVDNRQNLIHALDNGKWDIVLSDYVMPGFGALPALELAKQRQPNLPFMIISGAVGEERAIEVMRKGAVDFISKKNLTRLGPAVQRELIEAENRKARIEAEQRFRTLADSLPQLIWTAGADGKFNYFNRRWLDFTKTTLEQNLGQGWLELVHPEDRDKVVEKWKTAIRDENFFEVEYRLRSSNGTYYWHLARSTPFKNKSGKTVEWFGSSTNIEDQKRNQEKLSQAIRMREDVLGVVSHDLRNPLGAILLNIQLLLNKDLLGDQFKELRYRVELIQKAAERMERLIRDLLDVAKIEAGKLKIENRKEDAKTLVLEAVEMLRPIAAQRNIELVAALPSQDFLVDCDRERVLQVFSNLIGNAIKFSPPNSRITIEIKEEDRFGKFMVRDQGLGINSEQLGHVFERFWQARTPPNIPSSQSYAKGAGLGLSIAKGIVEAHGGRIWAESAENKGSTFSFTLRRAA